MTTDDKAEGADLELLKFRLERSRHRTDLAKWVAIAVGAVVSFGVIDYGNLQLERFRATAENQRQLLESYLTATDSPEPEVWKRRLNVLIQVADDERIRAWAQSELLYIQEFAERNALYRETPQVASKLIDPSRLSDPDRILARVRFEQLYWVDLPFVHEGKKVEAAMVQFRNALLAAEQAPTNPALWSKLPGLLYNLALTLRDETPDDPRRLGGTPG